MQEVKLRQPIVTILGHVDHGKTTLLDTIRQTAIAAREPGQITQSIGASAIPSSVLEKLCGPLLNRFKFKVTVPGLLFIDTPGHEAFTSLRKRGGALADLAVLVVDISEGLKPQTIESLEILRAEKTPFLVAVNKVDRIQGWRPAKGVSSFLENFQLQSDSAKQNVEEAFYKVIAQLSEHGFSADRFDRVADFRKTVAAVPAAGKSGEGIPELLAVLVGLAQAFLKEQLKLTEEAKGSVLEVKEAPGLGMTIDTIIYDGILKRGDWLVVGGTTPFATKIRALLEPAPMREMRAEKKFQQVQEVRAAAGVKIAAPELEKATSGAEVRTAADEKSAKAMLAELEKEIKEREIVTEREGIVLKADTIGSLEAMLILFKDYPIKEATLGSPARESLIHAEANSDPFNRIIMAFNVPVGDEILHLAKDRNVGILQSNIIYHLLEEYRKWKAKTEEDLRKKELEGVTRPAKIKLLPGFTFRASGPAVVGVEVAGLLRPCQLFKPAKGPIGSLRQIQAEGKTIAEATQGMRVAVSIEGPTVGRQIQENDTLYSDISTEEYKKLKQFSDLISEAEKSLLPEIFAEKRKLDPRFGL
jgi:translation initiation factor 5B